MRLGRKESESGQCVCVCIANERKQKGGKRERVYAQQACSLMYGCVQLEETGTNIGSARRR